jgi:hypothetical protein
MGLINLFKKDPNVKIVAMIFKALAELSAITSSQRLGLRVNKKNLLKNKAIFGYTNRFWFNSEGPKSFNVQDQ